MRIVLLTLFPEYFSGLFDVSLIGKALSKGVATIEVCNIRDFATDVHHRTDDRPFGGGAGMVMQVEPIVRALESIKETISTDKKVIVLLTSAQGKLYTQAMARDYAAQDVVIIICGHYEGVDERIAEHFVDHEIRIGNFVLSGGEGAAAVITDSIIRLLPGTLGNEESIVGESHDTPGTLGFPQYTRPQEFRGMRVPDVLMSGDHKKIEEWRESHRKSNTTKKS